MPPAPEDDPVRAIRAAREVHDLVDDLSPQFEGRIGEPLSMHTGINTGLVVASKVDPDRGIGKSRLVEEFKAILDLREIQSLRQKGSVLNSGKPVFKRQCRQFLGLWPRGRPRSFALRTFTGLILPLWNLSA